MFWRRKAEPTPQIKGVAVVVVDMQPRYLKSLGRAILEKLLANQTKVLRFCVQHNLPIVVLEFGPIWQKGRTHHELRDVLRQAKLKSFIVKRENNGFTNTSLRPVLDRHQVKKIVVMGVNASCCVFETIENAKGFGYQVITNQDLMADSQSFWWAERADAWYKENGVLRPTVDFLLTEISRQLDF